MNVQLRAKSITAGIGDIILFYGSLIAVLLVRSGSSFSLEIVRLHLFPFSIILGLWVLVFYIAGLYDPHRFRNSFNFFSSLFISISINIALAILFFYLFTFFGIAPKTTLAGFAITFFILEAFWRRSFNRYASLHAEKTPVVFLGETKLTSVLTALIHENPHLGYSVVGLFRDSSEFPQTTHKTIIVPYTASLDSAEASPNILSLLTEGVEVKTDVLFYEELLRKIPITAIDNHWFFEHTFASATLYDQFKRFIEIIGALILQIIVLPIEILISLFIFITSPGPVIYTQTRVGRHNKIFTLYKFRSMRMNAEQNGAQWSTGAHDPRVTFFGKFLRHSHLDELPQLFNIIRGEVSFVGPRPERPEIVKNLTKDVPFYSTRYSVAPGITGWAQINFKKDGTVEDVKEKLEYDLYYIKHRSALFDLAIIIRTIRSFFINQR